MAQRSTSAQRNAAIALTAASAPVLQRQCACGQHAAEGECEDCKKDKMSLNRQAAGSAPIAAGADARSAIESPGQPLDAEVRETMESRFQHDFSGVRVHTGARAADSAKALNANAYALGSDVVFGHNRYEPASTQGMRLIAHELAHVVQQDNAQQANAPAPGPQTELEVSQPGDAAEQEADRAAEQVMSGSTASVRQRPGAETIHRWNSTDTTVAEAVGGVVLGIGAVIGLGFLLDWLLSDDSDKIENPPKCGEKQLKKIRKSMPKATSLMSKALATLRAFKSEPKAPANDKTRGFLALRFGKTAPDEPAVVDRIDKVFARVAALLPVPESKMQCQSEKSEKLCEGFAEAYVGGGTINFCPSFFRNDANPMSIIHELSHAVTGAGGTSRTGGAPVTDRGYPSERVINSLSTDEALTNAASYELFIDDLIAGSATSTAHPDDKFDCPDDTKKLAQTALARAQRWNTNAVNTMGGTLGPEENKLRLKHLPAPPTAAVAPAGTTSPVANAPDLPQVADRYKTARKNLFDAIHVICVDDKEGAKHGGGTAYATGSDRKIYLVSPAWEAQDEDHRILSMLSALYRAVGVEDRPAWQDGMANLALDVTSYRAVPSHLKTVGDSTWTPDALAIEFQNDNAKLHKLYRTTKKDQPHLSTDLPVYQGVPCKPAPLPFYFNVSFLVDETGKDRPGPFAPQSVSMDYSFTSTEPGHNIAKHAVEPQATYDGAGQPLNAGDTIRQQQVLNFDVNGTFQISLQMQDPDSTTTLKYDDRIPVEAIPPCNPTPPAKKKPTPKKSKPGGHAKHAEAGPDPSKSEAEEEVNA